MATCLTALFVDMADWGLTLFVMLLVLGGGNLFLKANFLSVVS
jgi:hypothetical protein